ncbi:unnamed protein product [Camellia sinensis]
MGTLTSKNTRLLTWFGKPAYVHGSDVKVEEASWVCWLPAQYSPLSCCPVESFVPPCEDFTWPTPCFLLCCWRMASLMAANSSLMWLSEKCSTRGVKRLIKLLSKSSDSEGYCIEIGNGIWDSWFMPLLEQTTIACEKVVKEMDKLSEGYNIVGLSQGNMVGRGIVEFCDGGPPVKNFISLVGPHAGTASIPFCG